MTTQLPQLPSPGAAQVNHQRYNRRHTATAAQVHHHRYNRCHTVTAITAATRSYHNCRHWHHQVPLRCIIIGITYVIRKLSSLPLPSTTQVPPRWYFRQLYCHCYHKVLLRCIVIVITGVILQLPLRCIIKGIAGVTSITAITRCRSGALSNVQQASYRNCFEKEIFSISSDTLSASS